MKRLICFILCCVLLLPQVGVFAQEATALTRIDGLRMIVEAMGYKENDYECPFTDIKEEDRNIVGYAFKKRWVRGCGDDLFLPDSIMTRECFITIVLRSLKYSDPLSFEWNNPYDRAFIAGIYPVRREGEFAKDEAEGILAKRKNAYSLYSASSSGEREITSDWDRFTNNLSFVSSQTGKLEYLFDLDECTIVIGYVTGTPHGSAPKGYVVFKNDGKVMGLALPQVSPWKSAMCENVYLSDDNTKLYYTCTVEKDFIGTDGVTLLQEAGVFEYCVDLNERTTEVKKVEKN